MRKYCLLLLIMPFLLSPANADSPASQYPKVTVSQYGTTYFTMIPDRQKYDQGFGVAYKLMHDGMSRELWRVSGWYAFEVFISNKGEYLVRMGNWAQGMEPSKEDLAVVFYKNGFEIKSYSTADLIKDNSSVENSVSHYRWQSGEQGYPKLTEDNQFHLKTIEGTGYIFDVSTGDIISEKSL